MKNLLYPFIYLLLAYLLLVIVTSIAVSFSPDFYHSKVGSYTFQAFSTILLFGVSAWLTAAKILDKSTFRSIGFTKCSWHYLLIAVLIAIVAQPMVNFIADRCCAFSFPAFLSDSEDLIRQAEQSARDASSALLHTNSYWLLIVNIVVMALLPSVCEEMFFRGVVQRSLYYIVTPQLAVWVSAIIFSAVHFQFFGFIPRLLMGAGLGYIFLYSGSLWTSVAAHFVNNAIVVIVSFYEYNSGSTTLSTLGTNSNLVFAFASMAVIIALYYIFKRKRVKVGD